MSLEVLRFELKYHFSRPLLYIFAASFFIITFLITSSDAVMPIGRGGNIARNAPFVIFNVLSFMSLFGLIAVAFFVAPAVNRDHEWNTQELFFSTPVKKAVYLLGRFLGATFPVVAAMMMSCAGIAFAAIMPWQDPEYFLSFNMWPYLYSMALFVLPNLYLSGAIFFSIATLTKRTFLAYIAVIVFLILYGIRLELIPYHDPILDGGRAERTAAPILWNPSFEQDPLAIHRDRHTHLYSIPIPHANG
jgi:ABC-type transport system involved in multi-copper enzyme maturation permease subunit